MWETTWAYTKLRLEELVTAPYYYPDMIWMVIPLITTLLIMQFYFGRYSKEEMGWNTAVGNTLVLFFIALDLLRHIYNLPPADLINFFYYPIKTMVALLVSIEALTLFFADFFRFLPKRLAFFISSPLPVNLTAYVAIALVYSHLAFDYYTILAALVLFVILFIAIHVLQFFVYKIWESPQVENINP